VKRLSLPSCPPTPQRSPGLHSPPLTKRPRRSVEFISGAVSAPVQAISRYRRGRNEEPTALNAEFEIDPTTNGGMPFAFDEVVRGRRHRHGLNAGECEECRGVSAYSPSRYSYPHPCFRTGDLNRDIVVVCGSGAAPATARGAAMEISFTFLIAHSSRIRDSARRSECRKESKRRGRDRFRLLCRGSESAPAGGVTASCAVGACVNAARLLGHWVSRHTGGGED